MKNQRVKLGSRAESTHGHVPESQGIALAPGQTVTLCRGRHNILAAFLSFLLAARLLFFLSLSLSLSLSLERRPQEARRPSGWPLNCTCCPVGGRPNKWPNKSAARQRERESRRAGAMEPKRIEKKLIELNGIESSPVEGALELCPSQLVWAGLD